MGISINKSGFKNIGDLMSSVAQDFQDNGFKLIYSDKKPDKATLLEETLEVHVDETLTDKDNYTVSPSSPVDENAVASISFNEGSIPEVGTKRISANFSYLQSPIEAFNVPLLGITNSLNNIFTIPNIKNGLTLLQETVVITINNTEIPTSDYLIEINSSTGIAEVTINNLDLINPLGISIKASYSYFNDTSTSVSTGALSEVPLLDGEILTLKVPVSKTRKVRSINTFSIKKINYSNAVKFESLSDGRWCQWNTIHGSIGYANISTHSLPITVLNIDSVTNEHTISIDITSLTSDQKTDIQFAIDNFNDSIEYTEYEFIDLYNISSSSGTPPSLPSNISITTSFNSPISTYIDMSNLYSGSNNLSGKKDGYNDTYFTPNDLKTVDINSLSLYAIDTTTDTPVTLSLGVDFNVSLTTNGQAKIEFFKTSIPLNTWKLYSNFTYQDKNPTQIKDCVLKGDIDGVNNTFDIGARLLGSLFTFESTPHVDFLSDTQPYRIHLDSSYSLHFKNNTSPSSTPETILEFGRIILGTEYQLGNDGSVTEIYLPEGAPLESGNSQDYETSYQDFMLSTTSGGHYSDQIETSLSFPILEGKETTVLVNLSLDEYKSQYSTIKTPWDAIVKYRSLYNIANPTALLTFTEGMAFTFTEYPENIFRFTTTPPDNKSTNIQNSFYKFTLESLNFWSRSRTRFDSTANSFHITAGNISPILNEMVCNPSRPVSYYLSITDRGFVLYIRGDASPSGNEGRFITVQRLVNSKTGEYLRDGHSPLVCLFSQINRNYEDVITKVQGKYPNGGLKTIWQIIVREDDEFTPSTTKLVTSNSPYFNGYWNSNKQISITENGDYVITIPDGITTDRHIYYNWRPDMIGFISANVMSEAMKAPLNMYNELNEDDTKKMREYTATRCSIGYKEGSRVLILTKNGGI